MSVLYKPGDYVCNFVLFLNAIDMHNFRQIIKYEVHLQKLNSIWKMHFIQSIIRKN